jgi:alpha-ketoglutaric semialdehyde dehydrogenase
MIARAAMGYAGQKCTATRRVILVGVKRDAVEAIVGAVELLELGDPAEATTVLGPVIDHAAREEVIAAARRAELEGGRIMTGGLAVGWPGFFVPPTVVDGQTADASLANDEVFGPIVTALQAKHLDEAIRISNSVTFGLVTSVSTRDVDLVLTALGQLDTGPVRRNLPTARVDFHVPVGGEKRSSLGPREQGKAARERYTSLQTVAMGPPLES